MGIKSAAKKVGKAIIFMKLFEDIKNNKEPIEEDIAKLKEIIEEWKAEAPEDKTAILASILVKAQEGNVEDAKAELAAYVEEVARNVAKEATQVAKIAKRKTIKAEDIKGSKIAGLTFESYKKKSNSAPYWKLNADGDGYLAGGAISA